MQETCSSIYSGKSSVLLQSDRDMVEVGKGAVNHLHDDDVVGPNSDFRSSVSYANLDGINISLHSLIV